MSNIDQTGSLAPQSLLQGRYIIIETVGEGGMGSVYKAIDMQEKNRLVAVKEMSLSHYQSPAKLREAEELFHQEAEILSNLSHPNLPRVYDFFNESGRSYLVMDFIEGETLDDHLYSLGHTRMPIERTLDIALQLCSVVEYLHTRQPPIVFRDLKPANVMLTPSGHIYLIDFGIARHFKPGQEKDTMALGSSGYAPPEQYGKSQTTTRADIYSLGAILHQMISGDEGRQSLHAHLNWIGTRA